MTIKKAKLVNKSELNAEVVELQFETEGKYDFEPGQFINIKVEDGEKFPCFRAYSVACTPDENNLIICIKLVKEGRGSNWLNSIKKGDSIEFIGPTGNFLFQNNKKESFFIATGTGVAPFKCMIEEELKKGSKSPFTLLFGVRNEEKIFYKEIFEKMAKNHDNFKFYLTLSRPSDDWKGLKGRVTHQLENFDIKKDSNYYICGLKAMTDQVFQILRDSGIAETNIFLEKYD